MHQEANSDIHNNLSNLTEATGIALEIVVFVAPASRRWFCAATLAENPPAGRPRHENRSARVQLEDFRVEVAFVVRNSD